MFGVYLERCCATASRLEMHFSYGQIPRLNLSRKRRRDPILSISQSIRFHSCFKILGPMYTLVRFSHGSASGRRPMYSGLPPPQQLENLFTTPRATINVFPSTIRTVGCHFLRILRSMFDWTPWSCLSPHTMDELWRPTVFLGRTAFSCNHVQFILTTHRGLIMEHQLVLHECQKNHR
jgi:hypothetical protein